MSSFRLNTVFDSVNEKKRFLWILISKTGFHGIVPIITENCFFFNVHLHLINRAFHLLQQKRENYLICFFSYLLPCDPFNLVPRPRGINENRPQNTLPKQIQPQQSPVTAPPRTEPPPPSRRCLVLHFVYSIDVFPPLKCDYGQ